MKTVFGKEQESYCETLEIFGLEIIPETPMERAFIQDTLGLRKTGDKIYLVRNENGCLETESLKVNSE